MRDPIVDDVDFDPIDVLLEEVMRGAATAADASHADRARARRRNGWLAAAALLLGTGVVAGVWWLRRPAANQTASPQQPQEPQPDGAAPRTLDELRKMLDGVRRIEVRAQHIAEWMPATDTVTMASDPDETAVLGGAEIAAFRDGLLQSAQTFFDDGQDGRLLRRAPLLEVAVGAGARSFKFRVAFQNGRVGCLFADGFGPFEAARPFADQLGGLYREALRNGRRARGEANDLDELRALPADSRSVACPCLPSDQLAAELSRFTRLERLALVSVGLSQAPTSASLAAVPPTLRALSLHGRALMASDVQQLARMPVLEDLRIDGCCSEAALAALADFGSRLHCLRLHFDATLLDRSLGPALATWAALIGAGNHLGGLREMELRVDLAGTTLPLPPPALAQLSPSLRRLQLTFAVDGSAWGKALVRTQVEALVLDGASIDDVGAFGAAASLRELSLRDTNVGDADVPALAMLMQLRSLDLTNTKITADGVAALRRLLPGCAITARPGVVVSAPQSAVLRKG